MMLSGVCLSVAYIGPKSRTERPRKTKGRLPDITFKVKGQGLQAALLTAAFMHQAAAAVTVGTYCYVVVSSVARGASAPTEGGEGRGHIVAAAHLQLVDNSSDYFSAFSLSVE